MPDLELSSNWYQKLNDSLSELSLQEAPLLSMDKDCLYKSIEPY